MFIFIPDPNDPEGTAERAKMAMRQIKMMFVGLGVAFAGIAVFWFIVEATRKTPLASSPTRTWIVNCPGGTHQIRGDQVQPGKPGEAITIKGKLQVTTNSNCRLTEIRE